MDTKDDIRRQMRKKRHAVGQDERRRAGQAVCEKLTGHSLNILLRAWRVCIYLSTKHEIPTRYIARAVWAAGRKVCVPAWNTSEKAYALYALDPRTQLITGHHGVREPAARIAVAPWDVSVFILPGLAFDARGGRLGYGAGHYDAILGKAIRTAPKIAVCYDWQVLDAPLPQEPHDIAVDWIVTDKRVIDCAAQRKTAPRTDADQRG
jgi:5-formyltetrahydrofolate cyclo-ligase